MGVGRRMPFYWFPDSSTNLHGLKIPIEDGAPPSTTIFGIAFYAATEIELVYAVNDILSLPNEDDSNYSMTTQTERDHFIKMFNQLVSYEDY